jgi:hypothetical protein
VGLIQIDATAEVLQGLRDIEGLELFTPTFEDLGADRYRLSGYAPETLIPDLEARGCQVRLLMTTRAVDDFHREVAITVAAPRDDDSARPDA